LLEAELIDENGLKRIDAQVDRMVEKSVAFADESPEPSPKDLYVFDYATEVPNIDRSLPGDHTGLADIGDTAGPGNQGAR
jgi:pyruvate dehydrogenase E1 component alpha subunit